LGQGSQAGDPPYTRAAAWSSLRSAPEPAGCDVPSVSSRGPKGGLAERAR